MEQSNQKIFFKDLIFTVLYQWKALVIVMIVFALLLGGFAVMRNQDTTVSVGGTSMTPENQALTKDLEDHISYLRKSVAALEAQNNDSTMMRLDSTAAYTSVLQLFVVPEDYVAGGYDPSVLILQTYRSILLDNRTIDTLAEKNDMSNAHFRELLTVSTPEEKYLQLIVYGEDLDTAQAYAKDIQEILLSNEAAINQEVGAHTVNTHFFLSGPKVDSSLTDKQNASLNKLKNLQSELSASESRLNQLTPTVLAAATSDPVLFAIIGAFLGAVIVVIWAWCCYICGGKVYNAKVLANRTGIRILGCVAASKKRDFLTRWFRKLDGRAQHTDAEVAAVNVRNLCKGAKKVLFMGTFEAEVVACMTEKLQAAGVESVVCPDPSVKADALEALPTCDFVVLAETCAKSSYESVEWAIQTVADHEKTLLGCVLIDG